MATGPMKSQVGRLGHYFSALPSTPEAVVGFIQDLADQAATPGGIRRILYSLSNLHRLSHLEDPIQDAEVRIAIRQMHRRLGRSARQALGIREQDLEAMSKACPETLRGFRNQVLIRVGYDALCRVGELVSINAEHVALPKIWLPRSKTDPHGRGDWLHLSREGGRLLSEWLITTGITEGPVFTGLDASGKPRQRLRQSEVIRVLKHLARQAGIHPEGISGHSLRVGAAQDLLLKGASLQAIMERGRWAKTETVMRYLENAPSEHSKALKRDPDFDLFPR